MRFNEKAASYQKCASIQQSAADWCASWLKPHYFELSALELGAGSGFFTRHLASREFANLLATDISPNMIAAGKKRVPRADWKLADAWRPAGGAWDALYSTSLLQWAKNPESVLKNWRRIVKPGGELLVSIFLQDSLKEFIAIDPRFSAVHWRPCDAWLELFKMTGFSVERWDVREERIVFPRARDALRSLHDIGAIEENRMSLSELRRFLAKCDSAYGIEFPITWKFGRIHCLAG